MAAATRDNILASGEIVHKLPRYTDGDPIPDGIIGATILDFGTIVWGELGEVVLVIEYAPADGSPPRRVALEFSELGMWVEDSREL